MVMVMVMVMMMHCLEVPMMMKMMLSSAVG